MVSHTFKNKTQKASSSCHSGKKKCAGKKKFTTPHHPSGWNSRLHYMSMGGQCGQSCPCCRAEVFLKNIDPDAKWGACSICLKTESKRKNKK